MPMRVHRNRTLGWAAARTADAIDFRDFGMRSMSTTATPRNRIAAVLNRVSFPILMHWIYEYSSVMPVVNDTIAATRASWLGSLTSRLDIELLQRDLRSEGDIPNTILHWKSRLASTKFWYFTVANEPLTKWGLFAHDVMACVLLYCCLTMLHTAWSGRNDSVALLQEGRGNSEEGVGVTGSSMSGNHRDEDESVPNRF